MDLSRPETFFASAAPLHDYWKTLPDDKPRHMLRAENIGAKLLPHVSLLHVVNQGADLQYDLICQEMKIVAPRLVPGNLASDPLKINPDDRGVMNAMLHAAITQKPSAQLAMFRSYEGRQRSVFSLILPLGLNPDGPASSDLIVSVWQRPSKPVHDQEMFEDMTQAFLAYCDARPDQTNSK
jgi:hypothetical protein